MIEERKFCNNSTNSRTIIHNHIQKTQNSGSLKIRNHIQTRNDNINESTHLKHKYAIIKYITSGYPI